MKTQRTLLRLIACYASLLLASYLSAQLPASPPSRPTPLPDPGGLLKRPPKPPDTLLVGDYRIAVERYEVIGNFNANTRTHEKLSGYGRIAFDCRRRIIFPPFPWGNIKVPLTPFRFQVVDSVRAPEREIDLKDALLVDPKAKLNAQISLDLPVAPNAGGIAIGDRLGELIGFLKPGQPEGIRVQFDAVQVQRDAVNPHVGRIISGNAYYPGPSPIPDPPFSLELDGFTLEVSKLILNPLKGTAATARLLLPNSIGSGQDCSRAAIDLGTINLSPRCEFYKDGTGQPYGPFAIANTTLVVRGTGYVADFSSTSGSAPGGGSVSWKGLILQSGASDSTASGLVYSNTGYLQAGYTYAPATVTKDGFSAMLNSIHPYRFQPVHPYGYAVQFATGQLDIQNNRINAGTLTNATVSLPKEAVRDRFGAPLLMSFNQLTIDNRMDLQGLASVDLLPQREFFWGDFTHPGKEIITFGVSQCRAAFLYFQGFKPDNFYPVAGDAFLEPNDTAWNVEGLKYRNMTGLTLMNASQLFIQSPDVPGPPNPYFPLGSNHIEWSLQSKRRSWINIQTIGVDGGLYSDGISKPVKLGNPSAPYYVGTIPFDFGQFISNDKRMVGKIALQFVESASFHSDVRGGIQLPMPTNSKLQVTHLDFTSTAQMAGGEIDLSTPANLAYWGLQLVPKPGFSSGGVLSVKTGQIILTAAGLAEKRHFAAPFYLTWGEMLASGSLGRLFFDYHTAGQQFDHFNYTPEAVALSDYPGSGPNGFLRVGGTAHLPFFGSDYLHILDQFDPSKPNIPYNNRTVQLSSTAFGTGFPASNLKLFGNWSDGLGIFDIKHLFYNDSTQNGFTGTGLSTLLSLPGGAVTSTLSLSDGEGCIGLVPGTDTRSLRFGPFSDITAMTKIWGCICIMDDRIDNITFGGSITTSANALMVAVRAGQYMSAIVHISPSTYELTLDGQSSLSVALSLDLEVEGHLSVKLDVGNQFMEGEVDGFFRTAAGAVGPAPVIAGASLSGEGQANWHVGFNPIDGNSYQSFQGSIAMNVMGVAVSVDFVPPFVHSTGFGTGLNAGFYFGVNAPKSEAWVLLGPDPRYQLNMAALPDRLTGVYGFVAIKQGIDLYVVSGEYEVFVGLGAFVLDVVRATNLGGLKPPGFPLVGAPYAIGNLGGRIHGEILGGLVSAGAWFNLQLIAPYPFHFEGTVGLEGCVAWVFCGSVSITVGLNTAQGFYIK